MPLSSEAVIKAKTLLGLNNSPTLDEIKFAYKALMKEWHPDKHAKDPDKAKEMAIVINDAYAIMQEFAKNYRYDLSEESIRSRVQTPQEWWENRFGQR